MDRAPATHTHTLLPNYGIKSKQKHIFNYFLNLKTSNLKFKIHSHRRKDTNIPESFFHPPSQIDDKHTSNSPSFRYYHQLYRHFMPELHMGENRLVVYLKLVLPTWEL